MKIYQLKILQEVENEIEKSFKPSENYLISIESLEISALISAR
jgi:hypothetical protein